CAREIRGAWIWDYFDSW
nr:immunoglobulin heavy chain junction region [Macaca mulatta]